jgi:hypothetical protein
VAQPPALIWGGKPFRVLSFSVQAMSTYARAENWVQRRVPLKIERSLDHTVLKRLAPRPGAMMKETGSSWRARSISANVSSKRPINSRNSAYQWCAIASLGSSSIAGSIPSAQTTNPSRSFAQSKPAGCQLLPTVVQSDAVSAASRAFSVDSCGGITAQSVAAQ